MSQLLIKNNAKSTTSGILTGETTLTVIDGSKFPATGDFMLTIWDKTTYPDPGDDSNMEIVRATSRTGNDITITRAQEDTLDVDHASGSAVEMLITAGTAVEMNDARYLRLNQSTPQAMSGGAFAGSGLIKLTDGFLGVDTTSYSPTTHNHDSSYLGISAKAADSELLDGHDSAYFQVAGSYLTVESDPVFSAWATANDHHANWDSAYGWGNHAGLYSLLGHNHDLSYLGISAKAADSDLLDGHDSAYFQVAGSYLTAETDPVWLSEKALYAPLASPTFTGTVVAPAIDGSTADNGDLTLQGTSSSTRTTSYVNLQPNGGNVGIGLTTPTAPLSILGTAFPVFQVERTTSGTTSTYSGFRLLTTSSGNMADTFGGGFIFSAQDSAAVINDIAQVAGVRDGADNSGALDFNVAVSGSLGTALHIGSNKSSYFTGATYPPLMVERTSTVGTVGTFGTLKIKLKTTQNMGDTFGPAIDFNIQDSSTVDNQIASIIASRSGADNKGTLTFSLNNGSGVAAAATILNTGNFGIGQTAPTAVLHLKAGTATASTAPLKLTVGTPLTAAEAGVVNHVGTTTNSVFTIAPYINSVAVDNTVAGVITKTDTGDPANAYEGEFTINTYDNTFKVYADGGWRQLATW